MAEIWLIRHGQSNSNAGDMTTDPASPVLTEKGRDQAKTLSMAFAQAPGLIVTTPYIRTQQTAEPTLARFPGTPVEVWPLEEFASLAAEKFKGTTTQQRGPLMEEFWKRADPDYVDGAGAESFNGLLGRIRDGFKKLQERPEPFIAVFTHGYVIEVARLALARPAMTPQELMLAFPATYGFCTTNCSVTRLTADAQGVRLHPDELKAFEDGYAAAGARMKSENTPLT